MRRVVSLIFLFNCIFAQESLEKKIQFLQERLHNEEKLLRKKEALIESLKKEIQKKQISLVEFRLLSIEKKIHSFEKMPLSMQKDPSQFFYEERKILTKILNEDPQKLQARNLLEKILRYITSMNRSD